MATSDAMTARGTTLAIAVLLPDVLGTYSDAGNAVVLAERARRRQIPAHVQHVGITDVPPRTADIYLLGGGEDTAQLTAAQRLHTHRLRDELAHRRVVLAVCAGFQLLGTTMTDRAGRRYRGAEVIDAETAAGPRRAVGEIVTSSTIPTVGRLTGFENHLGRTRLGPGLAPLGHVEQGVGNGLPHDDAVHGVVDGVVTPTVIGTYLHGPVLARNPALADHLLTLAVGQLLTPLDLPDQDAVRRTYLSTQPRRRRGHRPS
jgi:lipid II isoglutaminyl synthase (glutamine-hydrolysing)